MFQNNQGVDSQGTVDNPKIINNQEIVDQRTWTLLHLEYWPANGDRTPTRKSLRPSTLIPGNRGFLGP